jgi:hypothetical protein
MKNLITLFILISSSFAISQQKVNYVISAEANALMCPFLAPKLMESLTKKGAENIIKDKNLLLHFSTSKDKEISDSLIFKLVNNIGYEAKKFHVNRTYD